MDAKRSGQPSTSTTDEKLEETRIIILIDRRVTMKKSRYNWASVKVQPILYCMTFLGSKKLQQGGCPEIWQKSISAIASKSAPLFWSDTVVKAITSWFASSLGMKPGFIFKNEKPNNRTCNGSTCHNLLPNIQVSALCWKAYFDGVLGLPSACPWTLCGERCHSNKCQLLHVKE